MSKKCFQYVKETYREGDTILLQKMSTNSFSRHRHIALLRGNTILEYVLGQGKRKRQERKYYQIAGVERLYAKQLFEEISRDDLEDICSGRGYIPKGKYTWR